MLKNNGINVLIDGQFGSTGKGVIAAYLAHTAKRPVDLVVSNAGPNSGHTFYTLHGQKIVLKQLPTYAVAAKYMGLDIPVYLSAGAIIDPEILNREVAEHNVKVYLSANAAVITAADKEAETTGSIQAVAGTRQGVGAALAQKVLRNPGSVVRAYPSTAWHTNIEVIDYVPNWQQGTHFVEVSQGFSLGINSIFYPKVTSRECTVMQALADARIPPQRFAQSVMAIRTYPIRVGNHEGFSSGSWYPDQHETTWEALGLDAEMTTVTQRVRRVATFSRLQYREALLANMPSIVFVNFMNYLEAGPMRQKFAKMLVDDSIKALKYKPIFLFGHGPKSTDVYDRA